jgi:type III pantothenate kinase
MDAVVVADIGNSRTRTAFWRGGRLHRLESIPTGEISPLVFGKASRVAASCVAPSVRRKFKHLDILWVDASLDTGVDFSLVDRRTIGADRVATAAAAAKIADRPAIIVDVGTAVTVDAISRDKIFLGGAILPGADLMMRSLHSGTGALPCLEDVSKKAHCFAGRNTALAMRSGVWNGLAGAVEHLVEGMASECGFSDFAVFSAGGAGRFIVDLIPGCVYIGNMVLLGVAEIWERNR